jgi:hypothetical protein
MTEGESDHNTIEEGLRQNSRKRRLNDKMLSKSREDLESTFESLNDWIHDDVVILDEEITLALDFCVDDASKIFLDEYLKDIKRVDSERQRIASGSLTDSPANDLSRHPDYMSKISKKIQELIPLTSELYGIRGKLNEIKRVKRFQSDEEYDNWFRAGEDESLS